MKLVKNTEIKTDKIYIWNIISAQCDIKWLKLFFLPVLFICTQGSNVIIVNVVYLIQYMERSTILQKNEKGFRHRQIWLYLDIFWRQKTYTQAYYFGIFGKILWQIHKKCWLIFYYTNLYFLIFLKFLMYNDIYFCSCLIFYRRLSLIFKL